MDNDIFAILSPLRTKLKFPPAREKVANTRSERWQLLLNLYTFFLLLSLLLQPCHRRRRRLAEFTFKFTIFRRSRFR